MTPVFAVLSRSKADSTRSSPFRRSTSECPFRAQLHMFGAPPALILSQIKLCSWSLLRPWWLPPQEALKVGICCLEAEPRFGMFDA